MEKYFTPVHNPLQDDAKPRKHRHKGNHQHQQPQHHNDHGAHEKTQQHSSHGSHHRGSTDSHSNQRVNHDDHRYDHRSDGYRHIDDHRSDEQHALSRSSSSSSLSTSSASSTSWSSEHSLEQEEYLIHKPQHSLSCSNIADPRHNKSGDWYDSEDTEFGARSPTPFQHSPNHHHHQHHHHQHGVQHPHHEHHRDSHDHGHPRSSRLHRQQSRSEEGLLQGMNSDDGHRHHQHQGRWERHSLDQGILYKSGSQRSLALSDGAVMGLGPRGGRPKKAVSTAQLPTKGILKNKNGGSVASIPTNFRKAKSMEVLSSQQQAAKRGATPGASKLNDPEAKRQDFVKTKLQFSAFLDEITRQVISPSNLNSLGVTPGSTPTAPRSPNQERKQSSASVKKDLESMPHQSKQRPAKSPKQSPTKPSGDSQQHPRRDSQPGKHPQPHPHSSDSPTGSSGSSKHKKHHSPREGQGPARDRQHHHERYDGQTLTDYTSTSLETIPDEPKHHRSKRHSDGNASSSHSHSSSTRSHGDHKGSPPPNRGRGGGGHTSGQDSESPSTSKSSSASASSAHGERHGGKQPGQRRQSKPHQDSVASVDRLQTLEQYNKELHENLLQTVACIENMETELQCSRSEVVALKDKYKRLQDSYGNTQQSNNALEEKLQEAMENMNSERKYLLQRVLDLTKQLDMAQNTISSLENINVPALIKDLLQRHFKTEESVKTFLLTTAAENNKDGQSTFTTLESDWLQSGQGRSEPVRMTAFMPWKQNENDWPGSGEDRRADGTKPNPEGQEMSHLPFTMAEISMALLKNAPDGQGKANDHRHPASVFSEIHSISLSAQKPMEVPPNPYEGGVASSSMGHGGSGRVDGIRDDFSSMTAQRILDNFMSQMPTSSSSGSQEGKSDPSN